MCQRKPQLRFAHCRSDCAGLLRASEPLARYHFSESAIGNRQSAILLALLLFVCGPALAAGQLGFKAAKLAEMDAAITNAVAENKLPGGVLWLERRGQIYRRAYGNRATEPKTESMTEDTIFDLASLTKVVATTPAVMLLIERGKVKLDEPVQTYLPEFGGEGREAVTIRHLLTHTSGLPAGFTKNPSSAGYDAAIRTACAEELQALEKFYTKTEAHD